MSVVRTRCRWGVTVVLFLGACRLESQGTGAAGPDSGASVGGSSGGSTSSGGTAGSAGAGGMGGAGGSGPLASISLSVATLDFGAVNPGETSPPKTLHVINSGSGAATNCAVSLGGTHSSQFSLQGHNCATIAPLASCNIELAATPQLPAGSARSATLHVDCDDSVSASSQPEGIMAFAGLRIIVEALYPNNGANWLDYVANDDAQNDRFHQDDVPGTSACNAAAPGTYLYKCVHGAEFKKVVAAGATSCAGLVLSEALGLFRWRCVEEAGPSVVFYSDGLREGKGIGDAIDYSGLPLTFLNNRVTITDGGAYHAQTPLEPWWSNTLHDVAAESSTADTPNILGAVGTNDIYVVTDDITTNGFNLNADKIGWVVQPGKTHTYTGVPNADGNAEPDAKGSNRVAVAVGAQSFTWIEGSMLQRTGIGVFMASSYMTRANNVVHVVDNPSPENNDDHINVLAGKGNHISGVKVSGGFRPLSLSTDYLSITRLVGSHCRAALMLWSGQYVFLQSLLLSNPIEYNTLGIRAQHVFVTDALLANTRLGFSVKAEASPRDIVLTNVTVANGTDSSAGLFGSHRMTFNNLLLVNSGGSNIDIASTATEKSFDVTGVHIVSAAGAGGDINFDVTNQGATPYDFGFHGTLLTDRTCVVAGAVNPGVTATCDPDGISTATSESNLDTANLFVGAVGVDDKENASDDSHGEVMYATDVDFLHFENRYRTWGKNTGIQTPSSRGPWLSEGGVIWDFSLRTGADSRVFHRIPAPTHGAACPAEVGGAQTVTDHRGDEFLINATELFFDYLGDDDGLCESGEACVYAPNIGAYQGHGDPLSVECVYDAGGGNVTGVTMYAYPQNGR